MNKEKEIINTIQLLLIKGGKEFIEEIKKPLFLFGELVTQIKGNDEEIQNIINPKTDS